MTDTDALVEQVEAVALLPCPFCGGKARHSRYTDYEFSSADFGWMMTSVGCEYCDFSMDYGKDKAAITAWNTRASMPAHTDETAEVQWEVWQDDMMVAASDSEADARHYLATYLQDGPASLVRSETHRTAMIAAIPQGGE